MSSTSFSITSARLGFSLASFDAFDASGDDPGESAGNILHLTEESFVFRDTTFKFTYASLSWDIGSSCLMRRPLYLIPVIG